MPFTAKSIGIISFPANIENWWRRGAVRTKTDRCNNWNAFSNGQRATWVYLFFKLNSEDVFKFTTPRSRTNRKFAKIFDQKTCRTKLIHTNQEKSVHRRQYVRLTLILKCAHKKRLKRGQIRRSYSYIFVLKTRHQKNLNPCFTHEKRAYLPLKCL